MDYPVICHGRAVGTCTLTEQGLYWHLTCSCQVLTDRVERLYCQGRRLGVLEREDDRLTCRRRLSKTAFPELPPKSGCFTLRQSEHWQGTAAGCPVWGVRWGDALLFPYDREKPCPCEPLILFFEIKDGFWQLPMEEAWELVEDGVSS